MYLFALKSAVINPALCPGPAHEGDDVMTSHYNSKLITAFLYESRERRELIKSEQIQYVTALDGLNS